MYHTTFNESALKDFYPAVKLVIKSELTLKGIQYRVTAYDKRGKICGGRPVSKAQAYIYAGRQDELGK